MLVRRFTRSVAFATFLVVTAPLVAPIAHAQPSAADKETARTLMQDGRTKRTKGDHAGALEAFRAAHQLMKVPTTGLEVGREQIELGQLVEARDTLLDVMRMPKSDGEPAQFAVARKDAQKLADAVAPRIPSIRFVVKGLDPDDALAITVDGVAVPSAIIGVPRKVNPGSHHVVVSARATERAVDVQVAEGATADAAVDFTGVPKPIASTEPATTPNGAEPVTTTTTIKDPAPPPAVESRGTSPLVWIGFGLAAVGAVAGTATGIAHITNTSKLEEKCPGGSCPSKYNDDYDLTKTLGTVSTVSFAVAGAGLVLGVVGLLASPSRSAEAKPAALRVQPVVGLGTLGVIGEF